MTEQTPINPNQNQVHLVLGGARSGKSAYAEQLVETLCAEYSGTTACRKIYIATAEAFDAEMQQRIDAHIERRGDSWHTIQEPVALAQTLANLKPQEEGKTDAVILIDCLTIWLNNLLHYKHDAPDAIEALCASLRCAPYPVILVSNEIGLGLVPLDKLSRQFRDFSGKMNQCVAQVANKVTFVAAGLPLSLKDDGYHSKF